MASGITALGPSVLVSSVLAAKEGGAGCEVIVLTDGLANYGIGSFIRRGDDG